MLTAISASCHTELVPQAIADVDNLREHYYLVWQPAHCQETLYQPLMERAVCLCEGSTCAVAAVELDSIIESHGATSWLTDSVCSAPLESVLQCKGLGWLLRLAVQSGLLMLRLVQNYRGTGGTI